MKRLRKDEAEKILQTVLRRYGHFKSLNELKEKFIEEARKKFPEASVSQQRLKALLKRCKGAKFKVHVKKAIVEEQDICPVCGSKLKKVYTRTLTGEERLIGLKCENCEFFTQHKKFKPCRYEVYSMRSRKI